MIAAAGEFLKWLRLLGLASAGVLLHTTLTLAHASLNATVPSDGAVVEAAPTSFSLTFSEPVSPLRLRVVRPDGHSSDLSGAEVRGNVVAVPAPADLTDGTHVLSWRVVSADGTRSRGR